MGAEPARQTERGEEVTLEVEVSPKVRLTQRDLDRKAEHPPRRTRGVEYQGVLRSLLPADQRTLPQPHREVTRRRKQAVEERAGLLNTGCSADPR